MKNLSFSIFVIVAFTLTYFYFEYIKGESIALWIILLIVLGQLIPVIILLIDYYVNSTGDEILVRNEHMEVKKGSDVVIINKEEIQKSTIYAAPSWNRNSTVQFFPFEPFHFVEIKLKTGKTVYITSLSDHNLYKNIQNYQLISKDGS